MQKRHCTLRAEWRLLCGQPAQPLSGHYRLGCDYGTPLITIYTNGDPVFLCGSHATAIGRPNDDCIAGVRLLEPQSADDTHPPEDNQRKPTESPAAKNSASLPTERSLPAPKIRRDPGPSKKRPVPDLAYGDPSKALVDEAIWNLPAGDLDVFKAELLQGRPLIEAAQSAGGQFAIIQRKIAEYTLKVEAILSESKATIDVYKCYCAVSLLGSSRNDGSLSVKSFAVLACQLRKLGLTHSFVSRLTKQHAHIAQ